MLTSPRTIELREFPIPEIGEDDGLLRVEASGVCGSDIPVYRGEGEHTFPVILGHEIAGTIERVGQRAAQRWGVSEGSRVVIERWIPCGHCNLCYSGRYRLCVPRVDGHPLFYGGSPTDLAPSLWGGYADHVYLHPNTVVYPVSSDVEPHLLPLFTPLANAISWVQKFGGVTTGSSVFIQGPGQEGLAAVIAARDGGASTIVVSGRKGDESRLALATQLGATHTVLADETDVVAAVLEHTRGGGADVVLDVTSTKSTDPVDAAIRSAATGGTIVLASHHAGALDLSTKDITRKLLTIRGVHGRDRDSIWAALALIESGKYALDSLITHEFTLEQTGEALQTVARERGEDALHVSIVP